MKPLSIDVLTIFPEFITAYTNGAMLGRAQKAGLLRVEAHQLRQWAYDRHQKVDDRPFGGGAGMLMKVAPFYEALRSLGILTKKGVRSKASAKTRVILLSPRGARFTQNEARRLSTYDRLVFLCGRYEGVDERVTEHLIDEELSIGDFVLTGGELGALVAIDAVARLRPGVLGDDASSVDESHAEEGVLEYPHYTRPEVFSPAKGVEWRVPEVLLGGNHAVIEAWRRAQKRERPQ